MLAWKMATDDSFMRGYNSTKMGARTNTQVTLQGSITQGIVDNSQILDAAPGTQDDQNNLLQFIATRAYPTPTNAQIAPQMHYLCDAIIRFTALLPMYNVVLQNTFSLSIQLVPIQPQQFPFDSFIV
ncbi:MAG: hypothetical protein EZS28_027543 [Streblomastix strix]|uniref:Uncharacterized protein n=1 Tax=Streblomastix strix TaxID=222440 RepID=A0A5J4V3K2_9EUKA|nr:MAG: hypothetical protein EZS28_027543 [Streblomastix strix]